MTVGCGDDPVVQVLRRRLDGSFSAALFGAPAEVASTLRDLAGIGIARIAVGAVNTSTYARLADHLPSARG